MLSNSFAVICKGEFMYTNLKPASEKLAKMENAELNPKELLFFIYENQDFFFLNKLEEDERYDFIMSLLPVMERVAENFDKNKAPLESYLRYLISINFQTWKKYQTKRKIRNVLIEQEYKHELSEGLVQEQEPSFISDENNFKINIPERFQKMLPILAYKASAYVTKEQILKIARISKTDAEEMIKNINILNEKLESRINNVKKINQRKTAAYIMRNQYSLETHLLTDKTTSQYRKISKSLKAKEKGYEKSKNTRITTRIVTPSWMIAEILGVSIYSIDSKLRSIHKQFPEFFCTKRKPKPKD